MGLFTHIGSGTFVEVNWLTVQCRQKTHRYAGENCCTRQLGLRSGRGSNRSSRLQEDGERQCGGRPIVPEPQSIQVPADGYTLRIWCLCTSAPVPPTLT